MLALALSGSVMLALFLILVWAGQRRMIYFPAAEVPLPAAVGLANVEAITFATEDGVTLHGWFLPGARSPARFTAIVFNGNAGNRAYRALLGDALRANGCSVLLFDYRGFGENAGTPTEAGLAADARAARGTPSHGPAPTRAAWSISVNRWEPRSPPGWQPNTRRRRSFCARRSRRWRTWGGFTTRCCRSGGCCATGSIQSTTSGRSDPPCS